MKETPFISDKILSANHIGRVANWVSGENVGPITVEMDMTNRCNSRCPGCAGGRENQESLSNPKSLIDQLVGMGTRGLIFSGGGEPLLDKRTTETINYAKDRWQVKKEREHENFL